MFGVGPKCLKFWSTGRSKEKMKKMTRLVAVSALFTILAISGTQVTQASEVVIDTTNAVSEEQPTSFDRGQSIEEVVKIIDNYYNPIPVNGFLLRAAAGTKWAAGTVEYVGQGSQLVTNYFWVKGSSMSWTNVVGKAQRNAVTAKYGSVNNNTSYKMKTQQKLNLSPQTQGYVTVSAQAWCYARD